MLFRPERRTDRRKILLRLGMLTAGAVVTLEGAATDGLRALLFGWGHLQEGVIYFAASLLAIHRG